jgi:hypothetical protein
LLLSSTGRAGGKGLAAAFRPRATIGGGVQPSLPMCGAVMIGA